MFQLDYSDHRPLYEQIKDRIKRLIISGALAEHDKIPSVRELAAQLAINPNTIQKAYKDLESEGYIYSQRARGSFVAPVVHPQENARIQDLHAQLAETAKELFYLGESYESVIRQIQSVYQGGLQ